jgi:hypothetical protein
MGRAGGGHLLGGEQTEHGHQNGVAHKVEVPEPLRRITGKSLRHSLHQFVHRLWTSVWIPTRGRPVEEGATWSSK